MNNQKSIKIKDLKPEYVRFFDPLFSLIKNLINILNYFLYKGFTKEFNPMNHLGAIANLLFGIATITGIILLIWYKPSVYQAYPSLEQLKEPNIFSYIGQLFRSLHRYSSDGVILFATIHLLKEISDRKIGGARWLAWVTGFFVLGIMWFEGWTGYWLVWDVRAQQIAIGTSKMLDLIPIFADPLSRTFLTDEHINTLLFFLIFFFHMLMPLAIIFGLWLHINRLNRSNWITNKSLSIIIIVSLIVISLIKPALSVESAKMQIIPKEFTMDYWYLLPLWFTDRLNGGVLWFITLILSMIIFSFPWIFYKQKFQPSIVNEERCQNCQQCFIDCPYNAILMIPREGREPTARVNPKLCVSCGICNGSCLPISVGIPYYSVLEKRRQYQKWKLEAKNQNKPFYIAFICANSILNDIDFDPDTGSSNKEILKDFYVTSAPCVGWVHTRTLELLLTDEGSGAIIIGCPQCSYREGTNWLEERLFKDREPFLRKDKVNPNKIKIIYPTTQKEFIKEIQKFKHELEENKISHLIYNYVDKKILLFASIITILILSLLIIFLSDLNYKTPFNGQPQLIVSFKHPGQVSEQCIELSPEELAKLPVHMRNQKKCQRKRSPVRMAIYIDDNKIIEKSYKPGGIWEDLNSVAIEKIDIPEGEHKIKIILNDSNNPDQWNYNFEENLNFKKWETRVILFDKIHQFKVY
jgi:quinol-cytochrome oxidoreductase complex cytochrome b subunit